MRLLVIMTFLTASTCCAQEAVPKPELTSTEMQHQSSATPEKQEIIVPEGTRIPMVLRSPVGTNSSNPGDTVRAETAFPVTVEGRVAIPLGTFVEGEIVSLTKATSARPANLEIRFTRLIFANGYEVTIVGTTAAARLGKPGTRSPAASSQGNLSETGEVATFQQFGISTVTTNGLQQGPVPTTLPPLPHPGPPAAFVAGAVVTAVVAIVSIISFRHHLGRGQNEAFWSVGSKIDLVLQGPLTLDVARVAAAAAIINR